MWTAAEHLLLSSQLAVNPWQVTMQGLEPPPGLAVWQLKDTQQRDGQEGRSGQHSTAIKVKTCRVV
jgi:hypothetical protein